MGTLKKLYTKLVSYLPTIHRKSRPSMWIVYIYGAGLIILFTFIIFSWVYEFIRTGNPNIQVLIDFSLNILWHKLLRHLHLFLCFWLIKIMMDDQMLQKKKLRKNSKKMHLKCQCYHRNLEERTNHD